MVGSAGLLHALKQRFADDSVAADSQQLGKLLGHLFNLGTSPAPAAACLEVLRAAVRKQTPGGQKHAQDALRLGCMQGSVALVNLALELGANPTTDLGEQAVWRGNKGHLAVLGVSWRLEPLSAITWCLLRATR